MGNVEPQFAAGTDAKLIRVDQTVAEMLKQEGIKHFFWVSWICRELRKFRPVYLPR